MKKSRIQLLEHSNTALNVSASSRKWYLIYTDNDLKDQWDIFITIVLVFSCVVIP